MGLVTLDPADTDSDLTLNNNNHGVLSNDGTTGVTRATLLTGHLPRFISFKQLFTGGTTHTAFGLTDKTVSRSGAANTGFWMGTGLNVTGQLLVNGTTLQETWGSGGVNVIPKGASSVCQCIVDTTTRHCWLHWLGGTNPGWDASLGFNSYPAWNGSASADPVTGVGGWALDPTFTWLVTSFVANTFGTVELDFINMYGPAISGYPPLGLAPLSYTSTGTNPLPVDNLSYNMSGMKGRFQIRANLGPAGSFFPSNQWGRWFVGIGNGILNPTPGAAGDSMDLFGTWFGPGGPFIQATNAMIPGFIRDCCYDGTTNQFWYRDLGGDPLLGTGGIDLSGVISLADLVPFGFTNDQPAAPGLLFDFGNWRNASNAPQCRVMG